jgi:putative phage-type endonuclease
MSAILKLEQGSTEWHAHRAQFRNASETPAVLGVSPWVTPYLLWQYKTGRAQQETTLPMIRGIENEPAARAAYEQIAGTIMQPKVMVDGEYSASLDGITLDGELIVEIKCPMKGRESELWKQVSAGQIPEHYFWQVQHQLMVSGALLAHFYVFDGRQGLLLEVHPKPAKWVRIKDAWDKFVEYMVSDTAPPLAEKDKLLREDVIWLDAASRYRAAKHKVDEAAELLDHAKASLLELVTHPSETGGGVTVTRYWKQGAIDYKRVPQLDGADLETYRGKGREEVRVTVAK